MSHVAGQYRHADTFDIQCVPHDVSQGMLPFVHIVHISSTSPYTEIYNWEYDISKLLSKLMTYRFLVEDKVNSGLVSRDSNGIF